jgi:hypothetical protein
MPRDPGPSPVTRRIGAVALRLRAVRGRVGEDRLRILGQVALAGWFVALSYGQLQTLLRNKVPLGQDIMIYYRGVKAWLAGGDPWAAKVVVNPRHSFSYAGSPATTVLLAPSALFTETQFTILWLLLTAASAIAIVRLLRLPAWWLLFPPTVEALYSGNPQVVVLALLLVGVSRAGVVADGLAAALKVYAVIPLAGERTFRRLVLAGAITIATMAIAPTLWIHYVHDFGAISARLAVESSKGYSAFYFPKLFIPTALAILALSFRDRRAAAWLLVPALWPATEFHYSTLAQPVMTPMLAVLLSISIQRFPPIAIICYVIWRFAKDPLMTRLATWEAAAAAPGGAADQAHRSPAAPPDPEPATVYGPLTNPLVSTTWKADPGIALSALS